jgi:hypothetical protein
VADLEQVDPRVLGEVGGRLGGASPWRALGAVPRQPAGRLAVAGGLALVVAVAATAVIGRLVGAVGP